jgi:putative transposase
MFGDQTKQEDTMAPETENTQAPTIGQIGQDEFQVLVRDRMRDAVRLGLIHILDEEVEAFIGAGRYQRAATRRDHRNGTYPRDLVTSVGLIDGLPVPRTRGGFKTHLFKRYQRRRDEVDEALYGMFVGGVSTTRVGQVMEALNGTKPSASTVSRVFHSLEEEYERWKKRVLAERYLYAFADGTYFTVIYDHEGHKMPILAVVGITPTGERDVLGFRVGDRENQTAWEDMLQDLIDRGVKQVDLWVTDGGQAMLNAVEAKFARSQRQRCVAHKMENVQSYIPKSQREQVEPELKAIFYQDSREQADQVAAAFCLKYESIYPTAVECLQRDLDACLTFYRFPKAHWKTIRTNNVIERLFNEVKKRTHKMAAAFRNEDSCVLMFYAVVRSLSFKRIPVASQDTGAALLHRT